MATSSQKNYTEVVFFCGLSAGDFNLSFVISHWLLVIGGDMGSGRVKDLRVFCMAEELADEVWGIVIKWDYFAKDTVGK